VIGHFARALEPSEKKKERERAEDVYVGYHYCFEPE